jgi:hypothetical protein
VVVIDADVVVLACRALPVAAAGLGAMVTGSNKTMNTAATEQPMVPAT